MLAVVDEWSEFLQAKFEAFEARHRIFHIVAYYLGLLEEILIDFLDV